MAMAICSSRESASALETDFDSRSGRVIASIVNYQFTGMVAYPSLEGKYFKNLFCMVLLPLSWSEQVYHKLGPGICQVPLLTYSNEGFYYGK